MQKKKSNITIILQKYYKKVAKILQTCYNKCIFKREGGKNGTNDDNLYINNCNIFFSSICSYATKISRNECKRLLVIY